MGSLRLSRSLLVPFGVLLGLAGCRETPTEPSPQSSVTFAEAQSTQYTLVDLGGRLAGASGINAAGQIVGSFTPQGSRFPRGFLWDQGVFADLGDLGPRGTPPFTAARGVGATGINAAGQIIGNIHYVRSDLAFIWQHGVMTELEGLSPHLFGVYNYAYGINQTGQVVGQSWNDIKGGRAVLWDHGVATELDDLIPGSFGGESLALAISPSGKVVGSSQGHAVLWWHGVVTDLGNPFGSNLAGSSASGINSAGEIVGSSVLNDFTGSQTRGFIWRDGVLTDLGSLGGGNTVANGINEKGRVVGFSYTAGGERHAFVWEDGVMTDLGLAGEESEAGGINAKGAIVGVHISNLITGVALWVPR